MPQTLMMPPSNEQALLTLAITSTTNEKLNHRHANPYVTLCLFDYISSTLVAFRSTATTHRSIDPQGTDANAPNFIGGRARRNGAK